jgi:hypothetical protein
VDLSEYVSQRARERLQAERQSSERQSSDRDAAEGDDATFHSPYAPKRAHERTASPSPIPVGRPPSLIPEEQDRRGRPAFGEIPLPERPVDLDEAANRRSTQGAHPPEQAPAPSDRSDPAYTDQDIERLEASLRWLQQEETATRLLHGARRPAAPPRADICEDEHPARRHRLPPRSLEPEHLVPPPNLNTGWGHWPLSILLASTVGAGVAYYFASGDSTPPTAPRPQVAALDAKPSTPPPVALRRTELLPTVARDDEAGAVTQAELSSQHAKTSRLAKLPEEAAPAPPPPPASAPVAAPLATAPSVVPQQAPPQQAAPAPATAIRTLDPEEIKLLVQQGEQFVATGDLVTARVVFKRAADAGDAGAAMALAATYDPLMLARLGVVGVTADVEKARTWYQKAASLGSSEATRRLSLLANQ